MKQVIQVDNINEEKLSTIIRKAVQTELQEFQKGNQKTNLTIADVASEMNVVQLTVRNWIKEGKLKASKVGGRIFIKREDLKKATEELKSLRYKR